jgi:hypothetical protein
VVENALIVAAGVAWFVIDQTVTAEPNRAAAIGGLVAPMVTAFPLIWPLLVYRPAPPSDE